MIKEIKLITKEEAIELLESMPFNRPLNEQVISEIVSDIENDKFDIENSNVVLKEDGSFAYGQHILNAIIKLDMPVEVSVITLDSKDNHMKGYYNRNSKYEKLYRTLRK